MNFIRKETVSSRLYVFIVALAVVLVCILNYSGSCSAEQKTFYAVLDIDRIVNQSVAYKEFKLIWGRVNDKYQKEIEFYESQLLELEQKITNSVTKKSPTKINMVAIKQKIGLYEVKVQKLLRERKKALDGAFDKATEMLRKNINKLVKNYAKKNNLSIIFAKSQVVYSAEAVDITKFILEKLNNSLKKLEVNI
jgi:Skp family chaperone for outer membrane proteins